MGTAITNQMDKKLLQSGLASFSVSEYNDYLLYIARSKSILVTDIDNDFLLDYHRKLKIQHFSNLCEEAILNGFVSSTNGNTYRTNIDDQINFIGKYIRVKDDETITNVFWKPENIGEQVPHTRDEFVAIYDEAFDHKEKMLGKLHVLRQQIRECDTDPDIVAITW